jgi:hypothetical protein
MDMIEIIIKELKPSIINLVNKYYKENLNYKIEFEDLLKQSGILADDNYKIIYSVDGSRVYIDKENPRTEITIKIKDNYEN